VLRLNIPTVCTMLIAFACMSAVRAADPQSYRVDLAATGDASMDATLHATSDLIALRKSAPVSPFGLIARARAEVDRLKTVLESYGYYQSKVTIQIEGMALNAPGLADAMAALPKNREARVAVSFVLGPLYHVRTVTIDGALPASAEGVLKLDSGAPAVAANVLAAGARLRTALEEQGYAFAKVDPPVAYEDATAPVLDVTFHVEAGPRVNIGAIRLDGLRRVHEKLIRRRLTVHSGELYKASAIERARKDLLTLQVFTAISVQLGTAVDGSGGVPITFQFRERPQHAVSVNGAYSSDLGGSAGVTWNDRNLLGNAEQLIISANGTGIGGSDTTGLGYDNSVKFIKPDFGHRDQTLQVSISAVKQFLQAYDQTAVIGSVMLTRKLSSVWTASAGVSATQERILQDQPYYCSDPNTPPCTINYVVTNPVTQDYTLIALPLSLSYDSTNLSSPLDDPLHGMRGAVTVTPTRSVGHTSATFLISQVKLAAYFDLTHWIGTDPGRSVLAARAQAGLAAGASEFSLPPDQRFYGGGSSTIRGYRYQAVGPQFCTEYRGTTCIVTGDPIGGTAITAAGVEFRQRFGQKWGAAVFVDGGQVSAKLDVLPSSAYIGVGAGVRYYTPIGPIRVDFAVPTRRYSSDDDKFEIYIGLGQAF
jgi:translocation and assembly module TamA